MRKIKTTIAILQAAPLLPLALYTYFWVEYVWFYYYHSYDGWLKTMAAGYGIATCMNMISTVVLLVGLMRIKKMVE